MTDLVLINVGFDSTLDFRTLPELNRLALFDYDFSFDIRKQLIHPTLSILTLGDCVFDTIPDFQGLPQLKDYTYTIGSTPVAIPSNLNFENLEKFEIQSSRITNHLPDFTHLPKLKELVLGSNQISGPIPDFQHLPCLLYTSPSPRDRG